MKRKFERYLGSTIKPKVSLRFSIPVGASLVDMYVDWLVHTLYSVNFNILCVFVTSVVCESQYDVSLSASSIAVATPKHPSCVTVRCCHVTKQHNVMPLDVNASPYTFQNIT